MRLVLKRTGTEARQRCIRSSQRVGTPFYTTRAEGTGLGVVLARTVIVQHGGEMNYQSIVGRGTTVRVTLPARPIAPPLGQPA